MPRLGLCCLFIDEPIKWIENIIKAVNIKTGEVLNG